MSPFCGCGEPLCIWDNLGPPLRGEAQPTLRGERRAHPAEPRPPLLLTWSWSPQRAWGNQNHLQVQGPWPSSLGRQEGASEGPLGSREKEALILSTPSSTCWLESLKMVFTIQLAAINYSGPHFPQTQTVTVSKIISGLCPKALLQAARRPPVYLLPSPKPSKHYPPWPWAHRRVGKAPHCPEPGRGSDSQGLLPACMTHFRLWGRKSDLSLIQLENRAQEFQTLCQALGWIPR